MQLLIIIGLLFSIAQKTSGQVTEAPGATVTYNPGEECLPYDGSVVPDCTLYVDPVIKEPYYKEHSSNCSRFWECGPNFETCLFECAHCGEESNQQCHYHEDGHYMPALAFDVSKQFPDGPVCNWPSDTTLRCHSECLVDDECCHNDDCNMCPNGFCNLDWTCTYPEDCTCPPNSECCDDSDCSKCDGGKCNDDFTCSYPPDCCTKDSDCVHSDGVCNVPAPHTPDNCAYCENKHCIGGCANLGDGSINCPGTHPNCNSHMCEAPADECQTHDECNEGHSGICEPDVAEQTECFYCIPEDGRKVCKPGCIYNSGDKPKIPRCHEDMPTCNIDTHNCQATPGSMLLMSMVFKSKDCFGCGREGVNMTLTGKETMSPRPKCKIVNLDHPNKTDFIQTSIFNATVEEQNIGWNNCWQAPLEGEISAALVSWTGSGTWSPDTICFDFDNNANFIYVCTNDQGTTLTNNGEEIPFGCAYSDSRDCFN